MNNHVFCNVFQIEMDFETLFDVQDNLYLKWTPSFADRVVFYANQQAKWQEYLHVDADNINSGKTPLGLYIVEAK